MSLFDEAMGFCYDAIEDVGGEEITYIYDGASSDPIVAVPGQETSQEENISGRSFLTNRNIDWMIRKDRLVIGGRSIEPKRGNIIQRADGRRYKVAAPAGGPCWRWSDGSETYYRIQTITAQ
jgi:hypothetical protein